MLTQAEQRDMHDWATEILGSSGTATRESSAMGSVVMYPIGPAVPTECSGGVHVFACERCRTCKCGEATLRKKGKK